MRLCASPQTLSPALVMRQYHILKISCCPTQTAGPEMEYDDGDDENEYQYAAEAGAMLGRGMQDEVAEAQALYEEEYCGGGDCW